MRRIYVCLVYTKKDDKKRIQTVYGRQVVLKSVMASIPKACIVIVELNVFLYGCWFFFNNLAEGLKGAECDAVTGLQRHRSLLMKKHHMPA